MPVMPDRSRKLIYAFGAVAGFFCATAWVLYAVFTSTSSTAAIGLLFVPVYGLLAAVIGWAAVYAGFSVADVMAGRQSWRSGRMLAASLILVLALSVISALLLLRHALAVARDPQAMPDMLLEVSQSWLPLGRESVLNALAQNPSTPASLLETMAGQDSYALVSLVGANPGTPLRVLEKIAGGARNYERVGGLATNPRITPDIAGRLADVGPADFRDALEYRLYQTFVLAALARNPVTPQAVFDRLAAHEKPEYFLAVAIIYADRASCAQIARAGESGGDNPVLRSTAQSQLKKRGC